MKMSFASIPLIALLLVSTGMRSAEAIPGLPSVTLSSASGKGTITLTTNQPESCFFLSAPTNSESASQIVLNKFAVETRTLLESEVPEQDPNHDFPFGLVEFSVICEPPAPTAIANIVAPTDPLTVDVTMTFSDIGDMAKYDLRKYGPTPDNEAPHWYDFGWNGQTGIVSRNGNAVTMRYVDNQRGDDILGFEDYIIIDQIGPTPVMTVPTLNEWGMILFMLLAGAGSLFFLRRNRRSAD